MKIAQITCTFPPYKGGIGNVAYHFAKNLQAKGYEVTVFTPRYEEIKKELDESFCIKRIKPLIRRGNAAVLCGLTKELNEFDVIHLHYPFFGTTELLWFFGAIGMIKKPMFIHYHMDVHGLPLLLRPLAIPSNLCLPSLIKNSQGVTCASLDYVQNSDIKNLYKKHASKFHEIPFGVDSKRFYTQPENKTSKVPTILFLSALDKAHNFKGLEYLFSALENITNKAWNLHVVGGGALLKDYKKLAEDKKINNRITFFGKVSNEDLPKMYQQADFFVFPSISSNEAFGLVLLEAMASGLPVIASNLPGVRSVFQNEKHGLLFRSKDSNDLANKITYFLDNPEIVKRWGNEARRYTEEKYQWSKCADELIEIYNNESLHN